jgi:hypothetical protein
MDGSTEAAILDPKTTTPPHPDEMAYVLHKDQGPVLVLGSGGGDDLRAALKHGQKEIYATEISPIVVEEVMRGRYRAMSGGLYDKPEVHVTVADGRSYVRRAPIKFRNIVIAQVDTWAAASVNAFALTDNSLYTVEAFRDFIEHLEPSGTLLVSRWDNEFERLLALGVAGLRAAGAAEPERHLFACGAARSTSLLLKRTPFTPAEIGQLRAHCQKSKFEEAFAPDQPRSELRRRIAAFADIEAAAPDHPKDLRVPTDDRPFFFYTVPPRHLPKVLGDLKGLQTDNQGLLALLGLLAMGAVLALVVLVGPLALSRRLTAAHASARSVPLLRPLFFFWSLGAGFVFVKVALVQYFVMFVGHPVYALSAVLVPLLLWVGIGSLLTARVDASLAELSAGRRGQLLVVALSIYAAALGPMLSHLSSLPFAARLALTLVMLAPPGLLMGTQAPLGVKLLEARSPELIPWCWGLKGAASVVAVALGTILAVNFGFSALLLAGGASYLLAALVVPRAAARDGLE